MPTLNDISTSLKNLAQLNVQRGATRAVKTGKLRDSINVKYRKIGDFGAVFDLNSVDYGVYVNFGTFKMAPLRTVSFGTEYGLLTPKDRAITRRNTRPFLPLPDLCHW